jgi:hypothetical protein
MTGEGQLGPSQGKGCRPLNSSSGVLQVLLVGLDHGRKAIGERTVLQGGYGADQTFILNDA